MKDPYSVPLPPSTDTKNYNAGVINPPTIGSAVSGDSLQGSTPNLQPTVGTGLNQSGTSTNTITRAPGESPADLALRASAPAPVTPAPNVGTKVNPDGTPLSSQIGGRKIGETFESGGFRFIQRDGYIEDLGPIGTPPSSSVSPAATPKPPTLEAPLAIPSGYTNNPYDTSNKTVYDSNGKVVPNPNIKAPVAPLVVSSAPTTSPEEKAKVDKAAADAKTAAELDSQIATKSREAQLKTLNDQLTGGQEASTVPKLVEDFTRLRTEQGIVQDQAELASIQGEARTLKNTLRTFGAKAGEGVTEFGRMGTMSEAERNVNNRLSYLADQETAVTTRINNKNAFIENVIKLEGQDYENASNAYDKSFSKNLQILNALNSEMDDRQKESAAFLTTAFNQFSASGKTIAEMDPTLLAHIKSSELQAYGVSGLFEALATSKPKSDIVSTNSNTDGSITVVTKNRDTGELEFSRGGGMGGETPSTPGQQPYSDAFSNAVLGLPATLQVNAKKTFDGYMQKGDLEGARNYLTSIAIKGLPAADQTQALGRAQAVMTLADISSLLDEAKASGATTNIIKGSLVNIAQRLGTSPDNRLSYIGARIQQLLQTYRRSMTGVAFSPEESKEYKKIFPDISNVEGLNKSEIQGLLDSFDANNRATLAFSLGGIQNYNAIFGGAVLPTLPPKSGVSSGANTVQMTSPDGMMWDVPQDKVELFKQNGFN